MAQGSQVCSVSWWETRHGAGLLGVCLLLPGTSARQGILAIAPSKQSYWECQIRHRAWSRQRGTRGSPGESVFLVQGQLAPHCHPPAHPTPGLHPFESLCPSGVFTMAPLWAQSAPELGGGWNRPTGLVQVTIWPSGTVWKYGLSRWLPRPRMSLLGQLLPDAFPPLTPPTPQPSAPSPPPTRPRCSLRASLSSHPPDLRLELLLGIFHSNSDSSKNINN